MEHFILLPVVFKIYKIYLFFIENQKSGFVFDLYPPSLFPEEPDNITIEHERDSDELIELKDELRRAGTGIPKIIVSE